MNTCEKCNNPVPAEKAFCPNCGAAMTPERERAVEYISEEMLPTMYDQDPPVKNPTAQQPPSAPVKVKVSSTPTPAPSEPQHKPTTYNRPNTGPKETPAANDNRMLYSILIAAAVVFMLSIIIVGILYMMGEI